MPSPAKKFFLTTPIYYVNARPHIGHAYTTIAADVIARRHRLLGDDTFFLTGTDEHGQKVQRSAAAAGIPPQQFADEVSASFRNLWKRMGITNDDFLRTTEARHHRGVQHLWRTLEARGAIYLSSYTGQYCVSDEAFVDVPVGAPCPECGRPTETITEENYFFRLSDYQLPLIDLIESGTLHIQPDTARNEVLSFLRGDAVNLVAQNLPVIQNETFREMVNRAISALTKETDNPVVDHLINEKKLAQLNGKWYVPGALTDLSISRTTFDWGIAVPGNPKHVVYVWLDALANYITAIGYGAEDRDDLTAEQKQAEKAKFEKFWPADLHLVGKEITRFHCVYWPAILLAAGLPLPKSIIANGWLLFEESKMSKSRGNVVRTETILDAFGPLCPPVPIDPSVLLKGTALAVPQTASLEATALAAEVTSAASVLSGGSRGLQPPESNSTAGGALAPGLTTPTKAQQDLFAADVLRYFLLREIPFGQDGTFSFDALITRYNADLANGYGNLVSRTLKMIEQYYGGSIPQNGGMQWTPFSTPNQTFRWDNLHLYDAKTYSYGGIEFKEYDAYDFNRRLEVVIGGIALCDMALTQAAPWKMIKIPGEELDTSGLLYEMADAIRIITALLYPILPFATASVWRQLGLGDIEEAARNSELKDLKWGGLKPGTKLGPLTPIFPRADKGLAQLMTDMENPASSSSPEPAEASSIPSPEALNAVHPVAPASTASQPSNLEPRTSDLITIDDFAKVDLRVAQIVVAERIPKADKLLRLEVDLGPSFPRRQILAGIAEHYAPEALIGRKVVIVANLAPRKMRGLESQGMVVAASVGPDGAPVLAGFLEDAELGARLK